MRRRARLRSGSYTTAIGHESAHIARRDFALNVLLELLSIPVSFYPAAWLMRRRIVQAREMPCDELVVAVLWTLPRMRARWSQFAAIAAPTAPGYTLGVFDGERSEPRDHRNAEDARRSRRDIVIPVGIDEVFPVEEVLDIRLEAHLFRNPVIDRCIGSSPAR